MSRWLRHKVCNFKSFGFSASGLTRFFRQHQQQPQISRSPASLQTGNPAQTSESQTSSLPSSSSSSSSSSRPSGSSRGSGRGASSSDPDLDIFGRSLPNSSSPSSPSVSVSGRSGQDYAKERAAKIAQQNRAAAGGLFDALGTKQSSQIASGFGSGGFSCFSSVFCSVWTPASLPPEAISFLIQS